MSNNNIEQMLIDNKQEKLLNYLNSTTEANRTKIA